jgi:hypothetical protein
MSNPPELVLTNKDALFLHTALYFVLHNINRLESVLFGFDDEWGDWASRAKRLTELSIATLDGEQPLEE